MANKDEQLLRILDDSSCLRKRQMLSYIKKELFPEELRAVEQHLVACKLCHDAIEGLRKLDDIENEIGKLSLPAFPKIELTTKSIEKKIQTITPSSRIYKRKKSFRISGSLSIAALITFGIVSIYFFEYRPNLQEQKATSFIQKQLEPNHQEEAANFDNSEQEERQNITLVENNQESFVETRPAEVTDEKELEDNNPTNIDNNRTDTQQKTATYQETSTIATTTPEKVIQNEQSDTKKRIEEKKENIKEEQQTEAIPKSNSTNKPVETDFDIGLSLFNKGNYASALLYFKNAESNKENPKHIDALYYSALCNKHLNKKGRARRMLRQVIKADGKFKTEAEKELDEL